MALFDLIFCVLFFPRLSSRSLFALLFLLLSTRAAPYPFSSSFPPTSFCLGSTSPSVSHHTYVHTYLHNSNPFLCYLRSILIPHILASLSLLPLSIISLPIASHYALSLIARLSVFCSIPILCHFSLSSLDHDHPLFLFPISHFLSFLSQSSIVACMPQCLVLSFRLVFPLRSSTLRIFTVLNLSSQFSVSNFSLWFPVSIHSQFSVRNVSVTTIQYRRFDFSHLTGIQGVLRLTDGRTVVLFLSCLSMTAGCT